MEIDIYTERGMGLMLVKYCDHCNTIIENKSKAVEIQVGGYVDSADLCAACIGNLTHIVEAFFSGDDFIRMDANDV